MTIEGRRIVPGFHEALRDHPLEELEADESVVFGLEADLTLAYLNPAWFRFAEDNGGDRIRLDFGLGSHLLDAISGRLRSFYERSYRQCLDGRHAWQHSFECSSPEVSRIHMMKVYPLPRDRLLVVCSRRIERPHGAEGVAPSESFYRSSDGLIVQCSNCRRVRRRAERRWDWVPEWVANTPANVSHGLCVPCAAYYFSDEALSGLAPPSPRVDEEPG